MFYSFSEEHLRSICRNSIESFELWARRIIHEKLVAEYGVDYFEADIGNNEKVLGTKHYNDYKKMVRKEPERCHRPVDALLIDALIHILCKEQLYKNLFKDVLDYSYPQGADEAREFLNRIINPRNPLSHANPTSIRQAEQIVCYTNDFIDTVKQYYIKIGKDRMWNTPRFIKVSDSLGNVFYPSDTKTLYQFFEINHTFYVGDSYKVWVDVDSSFGDNEYEIHIDMEHGRGASNNSKEFMIVFTEQDISADNTITCVLIQNKPWHKHTGFDHRIGINFQVLPIS